jgi:hypothetical protein
MGGRVSWARTAIGLDFFGDRGRALAGKSNPDRLTGALPKAGFRVIGKETSENDAQIRRSLRGSKLEQVANVDNDHLSHGRRASFQIEQIAGEKTTMFGRRDRRGKYFIEIKPGTLSGSRHATPPSRAPMTLGAPRSALIARDTAKPRKAPIRRRGRLRHGVTFA